MWDLGSIKKQNKTKQTWKKEGSPWGGSPAWGNGGRGVWFSVAGRAEVASVSWQGSLTLEVRTQQFPWQFTSQILWMWALLLEAQFRVCPSIIPVNL